MKRSVHTPIGKSMSSPPARGRGLKRKLIVGYRAPHLSPPARGRGLKLLGLAPGLWGSSRPPHGGVD